MNSSFHNASAAYIRCNEFSGKPENVLCPICINPSHPRLIFKKSNGVGIWHCPECDIMYASPRFSKEFLLKIYENEAFADLSFYDEWSYDKWKRENRNKSYVTQKLKLQLLRRFLSEKDRILDVGCGTGLFCLEGLRQGLNMEGIEPSSMLVEIGRKALNVSIQQGLLEDFDPGYKYSGIVIWDVLEHVYDPVELAKRCNFLMKAGGYMFVQVPNYDGVSNRLKTFMCRRGIKNSDFKHFGFPWHVYSFNRRSLATLLRAGGFTPLVFESWSHLSKEGAEGLFQKIVIWTAKAFCLSDYITCVARKKQ